MASVAKPVKIREGAFDAIFDTATFESLVNIVVAVNISIKAVEVMKTTSS